MITLTLQGPIIPKARARVTRNGTFHPHRYQQWKDKAIASLQSQYDGSPLSGVTVSILLTGKHRRSGDADNLAGACLDSLVQSGVLKDDSLMHVTGILLRLEYSKESPLAEICLERPE